jgi:hypothetical protein
MKVLQDITVYEIIREGREYGVRNKETGQIDHIGWTSRKALLSWWDVTFGANEAYRLELH